MTMLGGRHCNGHHSVKVRAMKIGKTYSRATAAILSQNGYGRMKNAGLSAMQEYSRAMDVDFF